MLAAVLFFAFCALAALCALNLVLRSGLWLHGNAPLTVPGARVVESVRKPGVNKPGATVPPCTQQVRQSCTAPPRFFFIDGGANIG